MRRDESEYLGADMWRRYWNAAIKAAKIAERIPAYNARHCHASWLIKDGQDLATVKERLGHNDLTATTRYVTVLDQLDTSAANRMGRMLSGIKNKVA